MSPCGSDNQEYTCSYCHTKGAGVLFYYSTTWDLHYCYDHVNKEGQTLCSNCKEEVSIREITRGIPTKCRKCVSNYGILNERGRK